MSRNLEKLEASNRILKEAYRVCRELTEKNESLKEQLDSTKIELNAAELGKSDAELEVSRLDEFELGLEKERADAELNLLRMDNNREKESLEAKLQKFESEIPERIQQAIEEFKVSVELDQYVLDSPSKCFLWDKIGGMLFSHFVRKIAPELVLDGYDLKLDDVSSSFSSEENSEDDLEEERSEVEPRPLAVDDPTRSHPEISVYQGVNVVESVALVGTEATTEVTDGAETGTTVEASDRA
ncbi:hypothetical protein NE237_014353 [Protea cynaroides]|uniref:Uncharacterized protein n=1 Tax=Protea cynaroides TaxID=273540 RepID=A0A9Q0KBY1_9MAGN|nr:hypothetical protein NE237_014353 [Protea cynaroides]